MDNLTLSKNKDRSPANRQNLYEQAIDSILNYIIMNGLKGGDKLPTENSLKDMLGISRNTLREALKSLQLLGIIESKQNVGIIIKDFSISDLTKFVPYSLRVKDDNLKSLSEAREWLEYAILPIIVQRRTDDDLARLWNTIINIDKNIRKKKEIFELDFQFHHILVECCKNSFISGMNSILKEFFTLYVQERISSDAGRALNKSADKATNNEHKIIFTALLQKDLDMLQKIVKKHLTTIIL